MGAVVVADAMIACSFGSQPGKLTVTSQQTVLAEGKPVATIQDVMPLVNISSLGMCSSLQNPQVAAATAAALGVLTPQPCVPCIMGTWNPAQAKCLAGGKPCLTSESTVTCAYMGALRIVDPGQKKIVI